MKSFRKKTGTGKGASFLKSGGEKVRVTSGFLRGRVLKTPGEGTHPMGAREKLALFNMIAPEVMRATVLDLYAGSGALGIEALSRGAKQVVFVESARGAIEVIRDNLARLGLLENAIVLPMKAENFFTGSMFDVIIADPPYDDFKVRDIEKATMFLKDGGILVLSHPGEAP